MLNRTGVKQFMSFHVTSVFSKTRCRWTKCRLKRNVGFRMVGQQKAGETKRRGANCRAKICQTTKRRATVCILHWIPDSDTQYVQYELFLKVKPLWKSSRRRLSATNTLKRIYVDISKETVFFRGRWSGVCRRGRFQRGVWWMTKIGRHG